METRRSEEAATAAGTATATGPPAAARWPVAIAAAVLEAMLVVDVLLGQAYLGINVPAVLGGLAVGVAGLAASRHLFVATVAAAAASGSISVLVSERASVEGPARHLLDIGWNAWPGMAEVVGLGLLAMWCVRTLDAVRAVVAVGSVGGAVLSIAALRAQGPYYRPVVLVLVLVLFVAAVGAGLFLRMLDDQHRRQAEHARHDERLAIARELHDVVAHSVTGIVVQAQAAQLVAAEQPENLVPSLAAIEAAGAEALAAMRRMVGTLRTDEDPQLAPAATLDDIRRLAEDEGAGLGLSVRVTIDCRPDDVPPSLAVSVHRIVREAITNARRHAVGATRVEVRVVKAGDTLTVLVGDDGRPYRAVARGATGGFGLLGMAERAEALGGTFLAGPGPGPEDGWLVQARFPLNGTPQAGRVSR